MRKFWAFTRIIWQNSFVNMWEIFVWFLIEILPVFIMVNLWKAMELAGKISTHEANKLVTYYVITMVISRFASTYFEEWLIELIKDGQFSFDLIKPKPIKTYLLADQLTKRLFNVWYSIPIFVILFNSFWPVLYSESSISRTIIFILILIITFLQKFLTSWILSLIAFWVDQAAAFNHVKWILEGILGGAWLPLSFFPNWWQTLAKFTPFYGWYYFPIEVLINKHISSVEILVGIFSILSWTIILWLISERFWKISIKHYSAVGG